MPDCRILAVVSLIFPHRATYLLAGLSGFEAGVNEGGNVISGRR
jgi:hypothetical protein